MSELRIHCGPGFRVYYAKVGRTVLLLLGGGTKRRQSANIEAAIRALRDFKERSQ